MLGQSWGCSTHRAVPWTIYSDDEAANCPSLKHDSQPIWRLLNYLALAPSRFRADHQFKRLWNPEQAGNPEGRAFLRNVRDGACDRGNTRNDDLARCMSWIGIAALHWPPPQMIPANREYITLKARYH